MGEKHYEPFYEDKTWEVKFEWQKAPKEIFPEDLEPVMFNEVHVTYGLCFAENNGDSTFGSDKRHIPIIKQGLNEAEIKFKYDSKNLEEYGSVKQVIEYWYELFFSKENKQAISFFTLFEQDIEHSDATNMVFRLKKPIVDLTCDEKIFLREWADAVGATDLISW